MPLLLTILLSSALLIWLLAALMLDAYGRSRAPAGRYDAILVPGCVVLPGGDPSPHLARRTDRAVALWRQGWAPRIVLTGGSGRFPPAEAEVAARYARDQGVPEEALVRETDSRSTEDNARLAAELVDSHRVLVVTDSYHVLRCRRVFARHFEVADAVGVLAPFATRIENGMREVAALILYALRGHL